MVEELVDVLGRPKLKKYEVDDRDVAALLVLLAPALPSVEVDVPLRDPDDAPVVGAAVAAEAEVIVSGDADLIEDDDIVGWLRARGINVLTPAEFLERLPSSCRIGSVEVRSAIGPAGPHGRAGARSSPRSPS
jgi:predicted nucleic acid-binding protein